MLAVLAAVLYRLLNPDTAPAMGGKWDRSRRLHAINVAADMKIYMQQHMHTPQQVIMHSTSCLRYAQGIPARTYARHRYPSTSPTAEAVYNLATQLQLPENTVSSHVTFATICSYPCHQRSSACAFVHTEQLWNILISKMPWLKPRCILRQPLMRVRARSDHSVTTQTFTYKHTNTVITLAIAEEVLKAASNLPYCACIGWMSEEYLWVSSPQYRVLTWRLYSGIKRQEFPA